MLQVHNIILITLSAWMAGSAVYWAIQYGYRFWGNGFKASQAELGITIYVFYLSKFYEFFDTVQRLWPLQCDPVTPDDVTSDSWCPNSAGRSAVHHATEGQVRADIAAARVPPCLHIVNLVRSPAASRPPEFRPPSPFYGSCGRPHLLLHLIGIAGGQSRTRPPAVTVRYAHACSVAMRCAGALPLCKSITSASSLNRRNACAPCAAYYSCALNSFVHVLMYTHYLLSAVLGSNMKARRKYLWWSRYLTQFQMFQFVTMMVQVLRFHGGLPAVDHVQCVSYLIASLQCVMLLC